MWELPEDTMNTDFIDVQTTVKAPHDEKFAEHRIRQRRLHLLVLPPPVVPTVLMVAGTEDDG